MRFLNCGFIPVLLLAAIPAQAAPPTIWSTGMVNAASLASGIAPGAMFLIVGQEMGPRQGICAQDSSSTVLGGTSVVVSCGGITESATMIYSSAGIVAGILPPTIPAGEGSFVVANDGESKPKSVSVVERAFGIFTLTGDGDGTAIAQNFVPAAQYGPNTFLDSALPGGFVVLWGTGMGGVSQHAIVIVGGKAGKTLYAGPSGCCAGMDMVIFEVPAGVEGCFAPVYVSMGAGEPIYNFAAISIAAKGGECSDKHGYSGAELQRLQSGQAQRVASVVLIGGSASSESISGFGEFLTVRLGGGYGSGPLPDPNIPTFGSCTVRSESRFSAFSLRFPLLGPRIDGRPPAAFFPGALTLHGPQASVPLRVNDDPATSSQLPRLDGSYIVENGGGTSEVGPFQASVQFRYSPVLFHFADGLPDIDSSRDLTVTWTGADGGYIVLTGELVNGLDFTCVELADWDTFTIPPDILRAMWPGPWASHLFISARAVSFPARFEASGLDWGEVHFLSGAESFDFPIR